MAEQKSVNVGHRKRTSPTLLDFEQVGDQLNVSSATVRRMVDAGKLKSVSVSPSGRKRMIRVVDLEEYLEFGSAVQKPIEESLPRMPASEEAMMRRAGWDGKDRLAYVRKPRT
jgi:excisionase family DNA binding protein